MRGLVCANHGCARQLPRVQGRKLVARAACNVRHVGQVVDTTGAGDTFNGVLAAELARGTNVNTAVKSANLASSISVTGKYAVSAIPTKETIERYKNL